MVFPAPNLNYPLAIFAIFLRRVVDKLRKMPKNAILKKSIWYSCYMFSQQQWPVLVAGLAISCTIVQIYRSNSPSSMVVIARNKAMGALNNSIRRKRWLDRRKCWMKEFHIRKTKDAASVLPNLSQSSRDKPISQDSATRPFQEHTNVDRKLRPRLPHTNPPNNPPIKHALLLRDKATHIDPPPSSNKGSQTENHIITQHVLENHEEQMQNLRNSFSQISLVTNNDSQVSADLDQKINHPRTERWQDPGFNSEFSKLEEQINTQSCDRMLESRDDRTKYMDPMCEILPINTENFPSVYGNEDDNKSEEEVTPSHRLDMKVQPKKRRKRKCKFTVRKKLVKLKPKLTETNSDSHLIRKTRSGRIYGYNNGKK